MRAVITAGATIGGAFAREAKTSVKALASVRGETMLARAIAAARGCDVAGIAVVGGDEVREACERAVERVIPAAPSGAENLKRALYAWPDDEPLLYLTSDLPYVDARSVGDFVKRSCDRLTIALTSYESFARRFPHAPLFGVRIGRERIVSGGAFVLPAGCAARIGTLAQRFFDARKRPWQMARLAGLGVLARFALGVLGVPDLEARAQRVIGVPVGAIPDCAPELAFDADDAESYRYAMDHR
ncbi:MAG: NTP transferase domain-containing protein [Candidatus Tyrphobacter sp.]